MCTIQYICTVSVYTFMCCHDYTSTHTTAHVHVPQLHEYVQELVTEHHTAYHPLNLLNGHTFGHTQVSKVGQEPDEKDKQRTCTNNISNVLI